MANEEPKRNEEPDEAKCYDYELFDTKNHPILNKMPARLKRIFFISTLYVRLCELVDLEPDLDSLLQQFTAFIPDADSLAFPTYFTKKIWKHSPIQNLEADAVRDNRLEADHIIRMSPPWIRYNRVWMYEDVLNVCMAVMLDSSAAQVEKDWPR